MTKLMSDDRIVEVAVGIQVKVSRNFELYIYRVSGFNLCNE